MPDYTGSLGLDISEFEQAISELADEIPHLESELRQLNAQIAILERSGKSSGAEYQRLTRVQKELGTVLEGSKKQMAAFTGELDQVPAKSTNILQSLSKLRANIGLIFSGVALGGVIALTKSLLNFGKEIKDTATTAGVLPEALQRIQSALSDKLSADDTSSALHTLNALMKETKAGGVEAESKLAQLGITFDDIKSKSPDEVLRKLADYVKNSADKTEALRAVTNAFGDDLGAKLIPALVRGGAAIEEAMKRASAAGDELVDAAAEGGRALDQWGRDFKTFGLTAVSWLDKVAKKIQSTVIAADQTQIREGFFKGAVAYAEDDPNNPKNRSNKTNNAPSARRAKPYKPEQPQGSQKDSISALKSELDLLSAQQEIARKIAPEYQKQAELLDAQKKHLEDQLSILDKSRVPEREKIKLAIDQNDEAQRALGFASRLRDAQISLNQAQAGKGRGFYEEQRIRLAELSKLAKEYRVAEAQNQKEVMASINAEQRAKTWSIIESQEAHDDELDTLSLQTKEMESQQKGLLGLVTQVQVIEKYQQSIVMALRNQNAESFALISKQRSLSQKQANAEEHDITPRQRIEARRAARDLERKNRQQIARDAEMGRRASGNYSEKSNREAAPINPFETSVVYDHLTRPTGKTGENRGAKGIRINESQDKSEQLRIAKEREAKAASNSSDKYDQAITAILNIASEVTGGR